MLKEFVEYISSQAVKGTAAQWLASGDPRVRLLQVGGNVSQYPGIPGPRQHRVDNAEGIASLANRFSSEGDEPVVWVADDRIVLVIDDNENRLETATFSLDHTHGFRVLEELRNDPARAWKDQKSFVRMLRLDLAGMLHPYELLDQVRAIRWSSTTDSTINRQKESLGREIEAKCTDGKDLAETVDLRVRVYTQSGNSDRYSVPCTIEVDAGEGKLRLLPLPEALQDAQKAALAHDFFDFFVDAVNEGVEVYYGAP